jgi:hypothetical protein
MVEESFQHLTVVDTLEVALFAWKTAGDLELFGSFLVPKAAVRCCKLAMFCVLIFSFHPSLLVYLQG